MVREITRRATDWRSGGGSNWATGREGSLPPHPQSGPVVTVSWSLGNDSYCKPFETGISLI